LDEYTIDSEGKLPQITVPANSGTLLIHADAELSAPPALVVLNAAANGTTVNLTWNAAANADKYLGYRSYLAGGAYELRGMTSTTTYADHNQISGQRVYYKVVAVNNTTGLTSTPMK
jgi:fibronectin type 3 domain-containing protein